MEKLVRDKIPSIIRKDGEKVEERKVSGPEYEDFLMKKLKEEVTEFLNSRDKEELADVLEVLYTLCNRLGIERRELDAIRKKKKALKGGFEEGFVIDF